MRSLRAISASRGSQQKEYTVNSKEYLRRGEDSFYLDLTGYIFDATSSFQVNRKQKPWDKKGLFKVCSGTWKVGGGNQRYYVPGCAKSKQGEIRKESTSVL